MRHLQSFSIFESASGLTPEQEEFLNEHTKGSWMLNSEGLVDIEGSFNCSSRELGDLKGIRFGRVSGSFRCARNKMTTLEGSPSSVGRSFDCSTNQMKDLVGGPKEVGGSYYCSHCGLETLDGAPVVVPGDFDCSNNYLSDLVGGPKTVGRDYNCYSNELQTLEGAPEKVGNLFDSPELFLDDWSLENLAKYYHRSNLSAKGQKLAGSLVSLEAVQRKIDEDPAKALIDLKPILGMPEYGDLKFPSHLQGQKETLLDLGDIGL